MTNLLKSTIQKSIIALSGVAIAGTILTGCGVSEADTHSNVGDNQAYTYEVTEIQGEEILGRPVDKESNDNKGIFLYETELSFDVKEGDTIKVVWGEEEDEFSSIEKVE